MKGGRRCGPLSCTVLLSGYRTPVIDIATDLHYLVLGDRRGYPGGHPRRHAIGHAVVVGPPPGTPLGLRFRGGFDIMGDRNAEERMESDKRAHELIIENSVKKFGGKFAG